MTPTRDARTTAPVTLVITVQYPSGGWGGYIVHARFRSENANYGDVPQLCPTFAFFHFLQQALGQLERTNQAI
ncbi:hypothetical protein IV417_08940 [Alphaproteobacteria bacterium KMM 3653]|uniref:Uncharacterized protein n=1 Tax=Harenicola maris TaxID=2841044 RepID=A0AAP2CQS1_9RHOB|nr:hypothetical protein [Harenicola maris]